MIQETPRPHDAETGMFRENKNYDNKEFSRRTVTSNAHNKTEPKRKY
jgi:hypothetical protein